MTKRVLMIAYYFPPALDVGRMRTVKFCKFLPEFGWHPVVVTCKPPSGCNPAGLDEIPSGTEVHRTGRGTLLKSLLGAGRRVRNVLRQVRRGCASASPLRAAGGAEASGPSWPVYLYWPDLEASWILPASHRATALAPGCNALYSSGWPMSCHVAALRVARRTSLPWIMDMRDPWEAYAYPLALQRRHYAEVERTCVATARWVINNLDDRTEKHRAMFPDQPAEKFVTIRNGVDPDDFADLPRAAEGPPLRLAYVGNLYGGRSAHPMIEAVGRLHQQGVLTPQDLHVTFMGAGATSCGERIASLGVQEFFTLSDRKPYHEALAALNSSHMALLFFGEVDSTASPSATKVYEVCHLRKPALAILPRTPLWQTLERAGGVCADPADIAAIADWVLAIARDFRRRGVLPQALNVTDAATATRRSQTGQLAELLDRATAASPSSGV